MRVGFCLRGETVSGGGEGSPGLPGQAEVRSSGSMGFPRQAIHFPVPAQDTPPPTPTPTPFVPSGHCKRPGGLFPPACLRLSSEAPPGPFCSRRSSPWLKGAWLQGSRVGPEPGRRGGDKLDRERTGSHGNPPGCASSELAHQGLELFISFHRETKGRGGSSSPERTVLLFDLEIHHGHPELSCALWGGKAKYPSSSLSRPAGSC